MSGECEPAGWEEARLDDVARLVRGITFPTTAKGHEPMEGAVACLRTANVQTEVEWEDLWYVPRDYVKHDQQYVQSGDVLISTANSYELVGKVARVRAPHQEASLGAFISLLRAEAGICSTYFYYLMSSDSIQRAIREMASTTTNLSNVSGGKLKELKLLIAPSAEQSRIVEELEELLSDLDAGVAELKAAQRKLAQYRQSLLKAAVEGALTADWRAARAFPCSSYPRRRGSSSESILEKKQEELGSRLRKNDGKEQNETGAELLQRILTERRARWEANQLARFAEQGKPPPKGWQAKYKEPVPPDTTDLPELPTGWIWSSLGQSFHVAVGATPSRKEPSYWGGDVPWVSSGEVRFTRIDAAKEQITEDGLNNTSTRINPIGSVLLGMIGEGKTRGQVAILDIEAANNQNCAAIWVSETDVPPGYVYYWLWSRYEETRRGSSGNNQPALNKAIVERIPFPLPPLDEINEIVSRVEISLQQSEQQEVAIAHALKQSAAQRKNILKAAFAGQLVPQDPNDEPASELLERIRAERVSSAAKRSGKTGRKRREKA